MNIALILAGGHGSRMNNGGIPKQFLEINGVPILLHTLAHFEHHPQIDGICVVCIEDWIPRLRKLLQRFAVEKVIAIVPGGKDGQASTRNGLQCIRDQLGAGEDTIVLIHDGVRPLINAQVISDNIASVRRFGSAVTVAAATETIVCVTGECRFSGVVDRAQCRIARAPQSYYLKDILAAHARAVEDGIISRMVDSANLMAHYGYDLAIVEGPPENIKVTTPTDFYACRAYLQKQEDAVAWGYYE